MSDAIPDEIIEKARSILDSINFAVGWNPREQREYIARALMAAAKEADEAATKRERERCAQVVAEVASSYQNGGPISGGIARLLDDAAALTATGLTEAQLEGLANGTMVVVPVEPDDWKCLLPDEQREQASRCGCFGADDYCACQNVPDKKTLQDRAMLAAKEG